MNEPQETHFPTLVKIFRDNLLAHQEYAQLDAKVKWAKYQALIKEGFSPEQALNLCK